MLDLKTGQLLREYFGQHRGRRALLPDDLPKLTPKSTHKLRCVGRFAGKHVGALAKRFMRAIPKPASGSSRTCSGYAQSTAILLSPPVKKCRFCCLVKAAALMVLV